MILYHGTNASFSQIDLAKGLPGKDFGRGFYTSDSLECARKTALQRVDRLGGTATVLRLEFCEALPLDLHIKRFAAPSREWALFVRANRRAYVEAEDHNRDCRYDVVVGPIANDKLSLQFRLFDKGLITLDAFVDALQFKYLYFQYSFHTQRAISHLRFLGSENVSRSQTID